LALEIWDKQWRAILHWEVTWSAYKIVANPEWKDYDLLKRLKLDQNYTGVLFFGLPCY
jgi:uncharacterized protein YjaG (DUF416 family)